MSLCDFNIGGFCTLEKGDCKFQNGDLLECTAEESDLIEICPDCDQPASECDCGRYLILVTAKQGKTAIVTPKKYAKMKEVESVVKP